MAYETIPPSLIGTTVSVSSPLSGDGSVGSPIQMPPASAATAGTNSIADFNKLAGTIGTASVYGNLLFAYTSATVDGSVAADTAWGADWPVLAGYMLVPMAIRTLVVSTTGAHAANVLGSVGKNVAKTDILNASTGFGAFATLNSEFATGVTKNFVNTTVFGNVNATPELTAGAPSLCCVFSAASGRASRGPQPRCRPPPPGRCRRRACWQ